jgi:hypothetical protein
VESELRCREDEVRVLRDDLHKAESLNEALQNELQSLRPSVAPIVIPPSQAPPPATGGPAPAAGIMVPVREIVLGRQTGGYDDDGHPGDEALQLVVEPRDLDGHAVKAPGSLLVAVVEITPEGLKKPLSTWEVPPDQVRKSWKNGLFTTGYYIVLPWKTWPSFDKLRVVAQFATTDGRLFEADKDITVRLPPAALRKPIPTEDTGPEFMLPPPRKAPPVNGALQPAAAWQTVTEPQLNEAVQLRAPIEMPAPTLMLSLQ